MRCFSSLGSGGAVDKEECKASCSEGADHLVYLGYIGAIVAVLFFGSNFVPVKKYETGDGKKRAWLVAMGTSACMYLVGRSAAKFCGSK